MNQEVTCPTCGLTDSRECPFAKFTDLCEFKGRRTQCAPQDTQNDGKPMHQARAASAALPRCGAYARTTGEPCKNPTMANGSRRCRMHGGKSTGPRPTSGQYTREARVTRLWVRALLQQLRRTQPKMKPITVVTVTRDDEAGDTED